MCADMLTKDSAAVITIAPYYTGAAPVRLENCTELKICYKQQRLFNLIGHLHDYVFLILRPE